MNISKVQIQGKTIFTLSGELDTATSPKLREELIPEFDTAKLIELDCAELSHVSSAGLRVLLMGEKTAKAKGGQMKLVNVSSGVMEIFEMTGFSGVLRITL